MSNWRGELPISHIIIEAIMYKDRPEYIEYSSKKIAETLMAMYSQLGGDFDKIMNIHALFMSAKTIDVFNLALAELYDYADEDNIYVRVPSKEDLDELRKPDYKQT